MIAIVDYKAGNLTSVKKAFDHLGAETIVTSDPSEVEASEKIVLPGVGHFAATKALDDAGLRDVIIEKIEAGVPFLGICVGMQLLATRGLEHGVTKGLDWIGGQVQIIERTDPAIKIPHMGWNDVSLGRKDPAQGLIEPGEAYFLHSYHFQPDDGAHVAAMTDHGGGLVAAVAKDNVVGVQFHPEKSQAYGLALLTRFLEWKP